MLKRTFATLIQLLISAMTFAQGQGAYHDAMGEEKSSSGGGSVILGIIIIAAILYFTQDKNKN